MPVEGLEERRPYLLDGETYQIVVWDEKPLDIKLPIKMVLEVKAAPHAAALTARDRDALALAVTAHNAAARLKSAGRFMSSGDSERDPPLVVAWRGLGAFGARAS